MDKSEERRLSLVQKLQKNEKQIETDVKKDKCNLENEIKSLQKDLEIALSEVKNLKGFSDELMEENAKLKSELKQTQTQLESIDTVSRNVHDTDTVRNEYEELKHQLNQVMAHLEKSKTYKDNPEIIVHLESDMEGFLHSLNKSETKILVEGRIKQWKKQLDIIKTMIGSETDQVEPAKLRETVQKLQESKSKIKALEDALEDMTNAKTIAEGEKCTYQFQVKDYENQLEHACKTIKYLEIEIDDLKKQLKEKEEIVIQLQHDDMRRELDKLREELSCKENVLKICEENKNELNDLLHKTTSQLEEAKKEVFTLQTKLNDTNDRVVRRKLEKELKEAENNLEQTRIEEGIGKLKRFMKL